ncbi:MAG: hypothetical protein AMJ79_06595 [Phycisphaerae bacterium SM23_30]|nr:MAG: hypothetical protein AMJ79_06595 [Phycisphaerae bacterium SM23_30]
MWCVKGYGIVFEMGPAVEVWYGGEFVPCLIRRLTIRDSVGIGFAEMINRDGVYAIGMGMVER